MACCTFFMEEGRVDDDGLWIEARFCERASVATATEPLSGQQWHLCKRHYGEAAKRRIAEDGYILEVAKVQLN